MSVDKGSRPTSGPENAPNSASGEAFSFSSLDDHSAAIDEIAAGGTSDAYLFRIIRALMNGEEPSASDCNQLRQNMESDE